MLARGSSPLPSVREGEGPGEGCWTGDVQPKRTRRLSCNAGCAALTDRAWKLLSAFADGLIPVARAWSNVAAPQRAHLCMIRAIIRTLSVPPLESL